MTRTLTSGTRNTARPCRSAALASARDEVASLLCSASFATANAVMTCMQVNYDLKTSQHMGYHHTARATIPRRLLSTADPSLTPSEMNSKALHACPEPPHTRAVTWHAGRGMDRLSYFATAVQGSTAPLRMPGLRTFTTSSSRSTAAASLAAAARTASACALLSTSSTVAALPICSHTCHQCRPQPASHIGVCTARCGSIHPCSSHASGWDSRGACEYLQLPGCAGWHTGAWLCCMCAPQAEEVRCEGYPRRRAPCAAGGCTSL